MDDSDFGEVGIDLPRFSFIDELINIKSNDVEKISVTIDNIALYLTDTTPAIARWSKNNDLSEFLQRKSELSTLLSNLDNIDSLLKKTSSNENVTLPPYLSSRIEQCNKSLYTAQQGTAKLKRNLHIALMYSEINDDIIDSLTREIELCLKLLFKLNDLKFSSPCRVLPKFNLQQILTKMKIGDAPTTTLMTTKSIRLPTFNDMDENLYNEYLLLESRVNPLKISLDILPLKIDEFHECSGQLYSLSQSEINSNYERLSEKWHYLQLELKKLKHEFVDSKWNEIFHYLIEQIIVKCEEIIKTKEINSDIASMYRVCSNSITVINQSMKESTIYDQQVVLSFNQNLLPKWQQATEIMNDLNPYHDIQQFDPSHVKLNTSGLRSFNTIKNTEIGDTTLIPGNIGFGIDLKVNIETANENYSIKKVDRIKDYFESSSSPPRLSSNVNGLLQSLQKLQNNAHVDHEEDDLDTLVAKTPNLTVEEKILKSFDLDTLFQKLLSKRNPSKLPMMLPNYIEMGLPVIKKKFTSSLFIATKIPGISPEHPVFHSPERQGLSPHYINYPTGTGSPIRREVIAKNPTTPNLGNINNGKIPNLLYDDISISFNSTSPERPPSSMGSRFDTKHLVQTLRSPKPNWR
jgi:hypothetical protein